MNRLIIIGNGFDLAHGLKTSVRDFGIHYFLNVFEELNKNGIYEDDLLVFKYIRHDEESKLNIEIHERNFNHLKNFIERSGLIETNFKFPLIRKLYDSISEYQWFNIEDQYFRHLTHTINISAKSKVKLLNEQFDALKEKFIEYLKNVNNSITPKNYNKNFFPLFTESILPIKRKNSMAVNNRHQLLLLDFNYTDTSSLYYANLKCEFSTSHIHIHGDLLCKFGEPVFGYGDEFNKTYLTFEELNNNDLYKHIKSFYYSLNSNYHRLTSFLDSNRFEVQIYGHSCGITDRTLLNQIFEHDNCESIKVFYHQRPDGSNDFVEKSYEIARHFNDKIKFRKRLIPFDRSVPMPQNK